MATNYDSMFADIPQAGQQPPPAQAQPQVGFAPGTVLAPAEAKPPTATTESEQFRPMTGDEVKQKIAQGVPLNPAIPYQTNAAGLIKPIDDKPTPPPPNPNDPLINDTVAKIGAQIVAAKKAGYLSKNSTTGVMNGFGWKMLGQYLPEGGTMAQLVKTIGANEAFNQYQEMKKDSPTGAAGFRLTQGEIPLLQATHYQLDPYQRAEDFQDNMNQIVSNLTPIYLRNGGDPNKLLAGQLYGEPTAAEKQAAPAVAAAAGASASGTQAPPGPGAPPPGTPPGAGPPPAPGSGGPPILGTDPSGRVILDPSGSQGIYGQDTGLVGEKGGTHFENLPQLAGVNATVNEMLKAKLPASAIMAYLTPKIPNPADLNSIASKVAAIANWQQGEGKNYHGNYNVDLESREVPNTVGQDIVNSDVGQAVGSGLNAASGFNIDELAPLLGRDPNEFRRAQAAAAAAHPDSTLIGTLAGGAGAALGAEALAARLGLGGAAAAAAGGLGDVGESLAPLLERAAPVTAGDTGYGAVAGAGSTDYGPNGQPATVADRLKGAAEGAAGGAVGSVIGQGVGAGVGAAAAPAGNEDVAALNVAGVPTTVGQQYGQSGLIGRMLKSFEDKATSLPVVGDMINAQRLQGIKKFNERAFDTALAPIGEQANGAIGTTGVRAAQQKISNAYEQALGGKSANLMTDPSFEGDLSTALGKVGNITGAGPQVAQQVLDLIQPYFKQGATDISGHDMQEISQQLGQLKQDYYSSGHVQKRIIGNAIDGVRDAFFGPFQRQAPEVVPAYNAANVAQARLFTVANSVLKANNKDGIFMPSQLGSADVAQAKKALGTIGAASGGSDFHGFQQAGQNVLPNSIPDSGTAGRLGIPAAIATAVTHPHIGIPALGLLGMFSRVGQRILTKPGRGATGPVGQAVANIGATVAPPLAAAEGRRRAQQSPPSPLTP